MSSQALGYECDGDGRLRGLRLRHAGSGAESVLDAGLVVEAIGLQVSDTLRSSLPGVAFNGHGLVAVNNGSHSTRDRVHAAGGLVNGGASVARCIAEGLTAAEQIHAALGCM
jgi:NADPH-dependent glutamate synthase beta subunit-like oxidoreductase